MPSSSPFSGLSLLITGHTGFTGGWAALKFAHLGADIHGLALAPDTKPALFDQADIWSVLKSHQIGDICDFQTVLDAVERVKPAVILHLAAQPLVLNGYADPAKTFLTNMQGTVHVLEAARRVSAVRGVVAITTDKVYAPDLHTLPYKETARLGGHDPYSASKAAAEYAIDAYRHSLPSWNRHLPIEVARGGNIFGGGDFAPYRIIPDFVRSVKTGIPLVLRKPDARRPWQHVLDLIDGYRLLVERVLNADPSSPGEAWNFGPKPQDAIPVIDLLNHLQRLWKPLQIQIDRGPPETTHLAIDASKAREHLSWQPKLDLETALSWTVDWYRTSLEHPDQIATLTRAQIDSYEQRPKNKKHEIQ